jgi:hypothetical protein
MQNNIGAMKKMTPTVGEKRRIYCFKQVQYVRWVEVSHFQKKEKVTLKWEK